MKYIKPQKAFEKLKKAEMIYAPVVLSAASSWGKSSAVEYFYRRRNSLVLYCRSGFLKERPPIESIRQSVVVIEDMHWIRDDRAIRYVLELLHMEGIQVVMLTRGAVPGWLAGEEMDIGLVRITERDLKLGEPETREFFKECDAELSAEELHRIAEASNGNPVALRFYANHLDQGETYSGDMEAAVWEDLFHLWDSRVYTQMEENFRDFALTMCPYESFTTEMAEYMYGSGVGELIEYCRDTMSQIRYQKGGGYAFRPEVRRFYLWKQKLTWNRDAILENYRRAADFYERHSEISKALCYYSKAGATQRIKEILIRNAHENPGTGHFIETKEYYFSLSREEIAVSPVLMAGMCMLCDLVLQPEQSEEWYGRLASFAKDSRQPAEQRREAVIWQSYLDISLPHRGIRGIIGIMRSIFVMHKEREFVLPEMAVTGNTPSLMNGGLDFSEWSKSDRQIAKFMARPVEALVGRYSNGLVTIALAESGFEKGVMSSYEVLTRCHNGFEEAAHGGRIEMCFAAVGVLARCHIIEGQQPSAARICETFRERAAAEKAVRLEPNIHAFSTWIRLFDSGQQTADSYLASVPEALSEFSILDRYRQMVKLRCLIAAERLDEAQALSDFLNGYFTSYDRYFYGIENELLKAVILYRKGNEEWKNHMSSALFNAAEFHFVRVISIEGTAVLPLLNEMQEAGELDRIPEDYLRRVMEETQRMALAYPDYLRFIPRTEVNLTNRETQILTMLCTGMSMNEICEELDISYSGLKKHNHNIYEKLGAKDRTGAERRAAQLGLVHRNIGGRKN